MNSKQNVELERGLRLLIGRGGGRDRAERAKELFQQAVADGAVPLAVDDHAYFLYEGNAVTVEIAGDWTFWQPATRLKKIEGTDLFYCALEFPRTARLQYKLIVDGNWQLDPSNPRVSAEGFGVNSEFWMPEHQDRSWLWQQREDGLSGTIESIEFTSPLLRETREAILYTPHWSKRDAAERLPLLEVHDGGEAVSIGNFPIILDNLIAAGTIRPTLALFVPPHNRHAEYAFNDDYIRFCSEEIVPYAIGIWKNRGLEISDDIANRAVLGASLGGLLATEMMLRFPKIWGACIAQSPAYWPRGGSIFRSPDLSNARHRRVILQTGTISDARELTRMMYFKLEKVGADVIYREYPQGHTWGNWRSNLADALELWIGMERSGEREVETAIRRKRT